MPHGLAAGRILRCRLMCCGRLWNTARSAEKHGSELFCRTPELSGGYRERTPNPRKTMSDQTDADLRRVAVGSSDLFGTFRKSCWDGDMIGFHFFRNRMRLGYYPRHPWDEWKFWRQFFKVRLRPNLHFRVWRFAISVRYLPNKGICERKDE